VTKREVGAIMQKDLVAVKSEAKPGGRLDTRASALVQRGDNGLVRPGEVSKLSTPELVARIAQDAQDLVKAEIQLAKSELRNTIQGVGAVAKRMAVAGVLGLGAYFTLLGAAVAGLSLVLETWAAALIVGGVLLVSAVLLAVLGARAAPRSPLERTRRSIHEDLKLAQAPSEPTKETSAPGS
jgi:Putative Actinobacterial Holin-X, holin superfamily III